MIAHSQYRRVLSGVIIGLLIGVVLVIASRVGASPIPAISASQSVVGNIDSEFAEEFRSTASPGDWIEVYSYGGQAQIAFELAEFIQKNDIRIRVTNACSSACVDLLIAAEEVQLSSTALIGVHWTSVVRQRLLQQEGLPLNGCLEENVAAEYRFAVSTGYDPAVLAEEVIQRLGLRLVGYQESVGYCWPMTLESNYEMWYLTSGELDQYLGIHVDSELCADSIECIQAALRTIQTRSTRVLAGQAPVNITVSKPIGENWVYRRTSPGALDGWFAPIANMQ